MHYGGALSVLFQLFSGSSCREKISSTIGVSSLIITAWPCMTMRPREPVLQVSQIKRSVEHPRQVVRGERADSSGTISVFAIREKKVSK